MKMLIGGSGTGRIAVGNLAEKLGAQQILVTGDLEIHEVLIIEDSRAGTVNKVDDTISSLEFDRVFLVMDRDIGQKKGRILKGIIKRYPGYIAGGIIPCIILISKNLFMENSLSVN
jgi:hypothetical protein